MAEKPTIEIFRRKDAEEFTLALADPESRTAVGSGAAMTAAVAAAYLHRAAALTAKSGPEEKAAASLPSLSRRETRIRHDTFRGERFRTSASACTRADPAR